MAEILIIDDEKAIRNAYAGLFAGEGYAVRTAASGEEGIAAFREKVPDAVLLDVDMPGMDGFETCSRIRGIDELVPVIFNTAYDREDFKEKGLDLGGDDYVLKTDSETELLVRVRRAIRRVEAFMSFRKRRETVQIGSAICDLSSLTVTDGDGAARRLTRTQADIIRIMSAARGRTFSADELIDALRGEGFVCNGNMMYVHISRLRHQLGKSGNLLTNCRRSGYTLLPQNGVS